MPATFGITEMIIAGMARSYDRMTCQKTNNTIRTSKTSKTNK